MARLFLAILVAKSSKLMETKRDVMFTKMLRCPTRISRICPQVRTLMLEVPCGSSASPLPRRVSALRVVSSLWGVKDALTVIVSAMESTHMVTAQVDSMWLKRSSVAHGGEVEPCFLGAGVPILPCHVQVRSCGHAASGDAEFQGEQ